MTIRFVPSPTTDDSDDTTSPADPLADHPDALTPENAFDALIFRNPNVCSNCFSRLKIDHRRVDGIGGHDKEPLDDYGIVTTTDDDGRVDGTTHIGTYGERARYPFRTFCGDCGAVSGRADDDTLSRRDALTLIDPLAQRLHEQGVDTSGYAMKAFVRHIKSQSSAQGHDDEMFRRAVKLGIRYAGRLDD